MSEIKYAPLPVVNITSTIGEAVDTLISSGAWLLHVVDSEGQPVGWLRCADLLKALNEASRADEVRKQGIESLVRKIESDDYLELGGEVENLRGWLERHASDLPFFVAKEEKTPGMVLMSPLLSQVLETHAQEKQLRECSEALVNLVLDEAPVGLVFISPDGTIRHSNKAAQRGETRFVSAGERKYRINVVESKSDRLPGYLAVIVDMTAEEQLLRQLRAAQEEAETALNTLLPDQRLENRLKSIVEYTDEYDPTSGKIRITGIIKEGVYRHVINMLRLFSDASRQGITELPGIDKNTMVQGVIFHDLGKVQPRLEVGEVVDPREVFEPGYLHALRSASLARGVYSVREEIALLIEHHHHSEDSLPTEYPLHLLPMHRLFCLLDGLSAAITRRGSKIKLKVEGTLVKVWERSVHPDYNRYLELDLYSGKKTAAPLG
ncbi:MAG: HD domain-containing protein [Desulfofundulus sp.]